MLLCSLDIRPNNVWRSRPWTIRFRQNEVRAMTNMIPFDTVKDCRLRAFWPTNQPLRLLAQEWGCSDAYVSQRAKSLGLSSRKPRVQEIRQTTINARFQGCVANWRYFEEEAKRRGLTPDQLRNRVLATVINDRMVGAVLDDAEEVAA